MGNEDLFFIKHQFAVKEIAFVSCTDFTRPVEALKWIEI